MMTVKLQASPLKKQNKQTKKKQKQANQFFQQEFAFIS